jgi:phosphate/sulfate permease
MTITLILCCAVALLAYANGANDNFKGVATLWGSGAATYRRKEGVRSFIITSRFVARRF